MNRLMIDPQPSRSQKLEQRGMTLLESLVAITMLVVFTGVVASVMQFTLRFSVQLNLVSRMNSRFPMGF